MRKHAAAFPGHAPSSPVRDDFRRQWYGNCFEKTAGGALMQRSLIMVAAGIFRR
jgi:hypothetical protein